jgi:hypothetical protein
VKYALFVCLPTSDEGTRPGDGATVRLRPPDDATTVRLHNDEVLLSDGPFAGGDAYVAAVDLVEAEDLDEAIALAARHCAHVGGGPVEVRPVWE